MNRNGSIAIMHGYSSKYLDESRMKYYGFRYYSSSLGRWISNDPIYDRQRLHEAAVEMDYQQDINESNLYRSFDNSSPNYLDYLGLFTIYVHLDGF